MRPEPAEVVAVVVARDGRLPGGADEAACEAGGRAAVVGTGAERAAASLVGAGQVWWAETPTGPATLAAMLSPVLSEQRLVILPASPDGRDLAPRLAGALGRPLLAGAVACRWRGGTVQADLLRADGRVVVPAATTAPAVATLLTGSRPVEPVVSRSAPIPLTLGAPSRSSDLAHGTLVEPDPATMDLAEAPRVIGGGAGLVPAAAGDGQARALFDLLGRVAAALGASAGATRVVTDAGWMPYDRQIGTTGVTISPRLYVALGVSGASQHVGGLGDPEAVVSVNVDPSCPMTALADLGIVADAPALLLELARRLGVAIPAGIGAGA